MKSSASSRGLATLRSSNQRLWSLRATYDQTQRWPRALSYLSVVSYGKTQDNRVSQIAGFRDVSLGQKSNLL